MIKTTLLIDTNYLCHRAWHAMGDLSFDGKATGAMFGVFKDVVQLRKMFQTNRSVFAFDHGPLHRETMYPAYKSGRRERHEQSTIEEKVARDELTQQIDQLRDRYLPMAGFKNVFSAKGFEADDIIARVITSRIPHPERDFIIVSADHDLWQLLSADVYCWNPHTKKMMTACQFFEDWGLEPHRFAEIKAWAGCSSDTVEGLPGIGEKTAAKYLKGTLGVKTKALAKIIAGQAVFQRNMKIVELPHPETPRYNYTPDTITEASWDDVADRLGFDSLKEEYPWGMNIAPTRGRTRGKK